MWLQGRDGNTLTVVVRNPTGPFESLVDVVKRHPSGESMAATRTGMLM